MSNIRLSESHIEALRSGKSVYDIRGSDLKGFGIRVLALGQQTLLRPQPARGTVHLEDHWRFRQHRSR